MNAQPRLSQGIAELADSLPLLLDDADMAQLLHYGSAKSFTSAIRKKRLSPPPCSLVAGRRFWARGDVLRWLEERKGGR